MNLSQLAFESNGKYGIIYWWIAGVHSAAYFCKSQT